jgi:hypothetical protein
MRTAAPYRSAPTPRWLWCRNQYSVLSSNERAAVLLAYLASCATRINGVASGLEPRRQLRRHGSGRQEPYYGIRWSCSGRRHQGTMATRQCACDGLAFLLVLTSTFSPALGELLIFDSLNVVVITLCARRSFPAPFVVRGLVSKRFKASTARKPARRKTHEAQHLLDSLRVSGSSCNRLAFTLCGVCL